MYWNEWIHVCVRSWQTSSAPLFLKCIRRVSGVSCVHGILSENTCVHIFLVIFHDIEITIATGLGMLWLTQWICIYWTIVNICIAKQFSWWHPTFKWYFIVCHKENGNETSSNRYSGGSNLILLPRLLNLQPIEFGLLFANLPFHSVSK